MIGRATSSCSFLSISQTSFLRFSEVGLHRLLVEQLLDLLVAVVGVVALRAAGIVLVELLVGIVDAAAGQIEAERVILARDLREPVGGLDHVELAVDIDLLQLVDQDDRGIAILAMLRVETLTASRLSGP